jgi:outer membrane protein TolC
MMRLRRTHARTVAGTGISGAAARLFALAAALGLSAAAAHAAPTAATLTVEDAVALALRTNPRLAAARARLEASNEQSISASRRLLPAIRVNEELQRYDSPFNIIFPGIPPLVARNQTTNTFSASADQPLLGLFRLQNERASQQAVTAAAEAQLAAAEADVRQGVQAQFLQYFEAQAMQQIAEASARELGEQVTVARARLASGVITRADLLRIEVAVANASQQALQAQSQRQTAYANLLSIIGVGADAAGVTLVEPRALLAASRAAPSPVALLLPQARARRPELLERKRLTLSADRAAWAQAFALLPDVDAEAAYLRIDGQVFVPKNSAYVGLRAQWAIWEWGATEHLRRAAAAQAAAARRDEESTERQIEAELSTSLAQGDAARGAVDAAEKAIASAEEAFRVTEAELKAGTATTTDLLESQSALTQARLNLTRAQYELALAHVTLTRASGG